MSEPAIWALAVIVALNSLLIGIIVVALVKLNQTLADLNAKADPVAERLTHTLDEADSSLQTLTERLERSLTRLENAVDQVSTRVENVSGRAEEVVAEPLIAAASAVAGVAEGLRTYRGRESATEEEEDHG